MNPSPSSDFKNSWYAKLVAFMVRVTASSYSAIVVAISGTAPTGMLSPPATSPQTGEESRPYGLRLNKKREENSYESNQ